MVSLHDEVSVPQEEGIDPVVPFPFTAQPNIDFGGVDAPVSQTVIISPASSQSLETFIFVVGTIGDV